MCLDHVLVKFEQNRMVRNIQKFELLNRKPSLFKVTFGQIFDAILEDVYVAETIVECFNINHLSAFQILR